MNYKMIKLGMLGSLILPIYCFANNYSCLKTPVKVVVSQVYNDWFIWPLYEILNDKSREKYSNKKEQYYIKKWNTLTHGEFNFSNNGKFFIACCRTEFKQRTSVCAFKNIPEKYCKEKSFSDSEKDFICSNDIIS